MTTSEAAKILGTTPEQVEQWQQQGIFPDPIPDDYLNHFVDFRIKLQQALARKIDRQRGLNGSAE